MIENPVGMRLIYKVIDGSVFKQKKDALIQSRPDVCSRHGTNGCIEILAELHGEENTPWEGKILRFHAASHKLTSGVLAPKWFAEGRISNDATDQAIGYLRGELWIILPGKPPLKLIPESDLWDQSSSSFVVGKPFWAPDREVFNQVMKGINLSNVDREAIRLQCEEVNYPHGYWTRPYERRETRQISEDHWPDTNQAGTPMSLAMHHAFVACALFPDLDGPAWPLLQTVMAQFGTTARFSDGVLGELPGRPCHLYDYAQWVTPWTRGEGNQTRFGNCSIQENSPDDFARGSLPVATTDEIGWNYFDWLGKRIKFKVGRFGFRFSNRGWDGDDPEHFVRIRWMFAAAVLTPSIFARNNLITRIETGSAEDKLPWGGFHSDRAGGWTMGGLILAAMALRTSNKDLHKTYWERARTMRDRIVTGTYLPDWAKGKLTLTLSETGRQNATVLQCGSWQVGIMLEQALLGWDHDPDRTEENLIPWRRLQKICLDIIALCVRRDEQGAPTGLWKTYRFFSDGRHEPNEADGSTWMGEMRWVPGAAHSQEWSRVPFEIFRHLGRYEKAYIADDREEMWQWFFRIRSEV